MSKNPDADAFLDAAQRAWTKRVADMPDEQAALVTMFSAWLRLKELGWSEAIHCPKDGTHFLAIEAGSMGAHDCSYHDTADGPWWVYDGDIWPSHPILWKKYP